MSKTDWWKGAVIYQVYPRSFQDSNSDGLGDLRGITSRLPYIASLGVDAIWLSPFFTSPQLDMGYDISNYKDIDPQYGTLADCDAMIARAHELGLKIIFDGVFSHTSDVHPWFLDSRLRRNGRDDWYVWADPGECGVAPNNWSSVFGGSAWEYDPLRGQYYLHNFLRQQPDLNYHNPDVQNAILDVARFWYERGIDGLRLDTVNYYTHSAGLENNPPRPREGWEMWKNTGRPKTYSMQIHIHDKSQPENLDFLRRLRAVADEFSDRFLMGEIGDENSIACMAQYTAGHDLLQTAYSFALLGNHGKPLDPDYIRSALLASLESGDGWPTWAFSNHDCTRPVSRFLSHDIGHKSWPKQLIALLGCLRGTVCIYQGEELGLTESIVPTDRLQDPWGGRDGCRTPMPWDDTLPYGGFSSVEPWLPYAPEHKGLSVAEQERQADSPLAFARAFLKLRKTLPALIHGDITFHDTPDGVLSFTRSLDGKSIQCVFNLNGVPAPISVPGNVLLSHNAGGVFGFVISEVS